MTAGPYFLGWQVRDAEMRFLAAPADEKLSKARKVIQAKFARGDYPMLQALDEATREVFAKELVDRYKNAPGT